MSKIFTSSVVFDSKEKAWQEDYYINGRSVDADTYLYEMDDEIKKIKIAQEEDDCVNCGDCGICEIELDDLLDIYADRLADIGNCPCCNKAVLTDFVDEILDLMDK
jgi:hypothetical protein